MELKELFNVESQLGIITGAGGALCGTLSEELAALGVTVVLLDIDEEKLNKRMAAIKKSSSKVYGFVCDVMNVEELKKVVDRIVDSLGTPDFLINGAGGNNPVATTDKEFFDPKEDNGTGVTSFFDLSKEGMENVFALNYMGTVLPSQVVGKVMAESGGGRIINISSMSALTPLTKVVSYSSAKAAVANLTGWLAVHLAPAHIRVNALAPGFFMTEQLRFLHIDKKTGEYTARAKKILAHTPLERYGKPEELLGAVVWLLSDASSFVTGALIPIDGGFSVYSI